MKNNDYVGIFVLFLIVVGVFLYTLKNEKELVDNKQTTIGKIYEASYEGGKYFVKYSFIVGNKEYFGKVRTSFFKCDDGIEGCQEKKFKVIYSKLNPNNNDIDLGKYNRHKMRNRIFK